MHYRDHEDGSWRSSIHSSSVTDICSCSAGYKVEGRFWNIQDDDYIWHNAQWAHWSATIQINHKVNWKETHTLALTHTHRLPSGRSVLPTLKHARLHFRKIIFYVDLHPSCVRNPDSNHNQRSINPEDTSSCGSCHVSADLSKSAADGKLKLNELELPQQLKAGIVSFRCLQRDGSE